MPKKITEDQKKETKESMPHISREEFSQMISFTKMITKQLEKSVQKKERKEKNSEKEGESKEKKEQKEEECEVEDPEKKE